MDSSRKLHHEAQQRVAIITFSETASQRGGRDTKRSMPVRGGNAERALGGKQKEEKNQARFQESETDEWWVNGRKKKNEKDGEMWSATRPRFFELSRQARFS